MAGSFLRDRRKSMAEMIDGLPILYDRKPCYDIVFRQSFDDLWKELEALGCADRKICVITDSKVDELYGEEVLKLLEGNCKKAVKFAFPNGGAETRSLDTVEEKSTGF